MTLDQQLLALCESAQLNQCPNGPPCTDGDQPLEEWCGVCLLVADIRRLLGVGPRPSEARPK